VSSGWGHSCVSRQSLSSLNPTISHTTSKVSDDLVDADEDTQKQLMPHLTAIDESLVQITKLVEGFILATLYDDADEDDDEVITLFRDMRESVYDEYLAIKERLDQVVEIV
jgi:hypothetical protein